MAPDTLPGNVAEACAIVIGALDGRPLPAEVTGETFSGLAHLAAHLAEHAFGSRERARESLTLVGLEDWDES